MGILLEYSFLTYVSGVPGMKAAASHVNPTVY